MKLQGTITATDFAEDSMLWAPLTPYFGAWRFSNAWDTMRDIKQMVGMQNLGLTSVLGSDSWLEAE